MRGMSESWRGEVVGRPEGERGKSKLKTERDLACLRRVQEGVMDQGKVCGHEPEGEGLRGEHVMAFTSISQRSWMGKGTRQEARRPIKGCLHLSAVRGDGSLDPQQGGAH